MFDFFILYPGVTVIRFNPTPPLILRLFSACYSTQVEPRTHRSVRGTTTNQTYTSTSRHACTHSLLSRPNRTAQTSTYYYSSSTNFSCYCNLRLTSISRIPRLRQKCNLDFHSGEVTRPLSAFLRLAMTGCPTLRARGELRADAGSIGPSALPGPGAAHLVASGLKITDICVFNRFEIQLLVFLPRVAGFRGAWLTGMRRAC
jgi:hypothetical protein